jgi:hypothetical protein
VNPRDLLVNLRDDSISDESRPLRNVSNSAELKTGDGDSRTKLLNYQVIVDMNKYLV